VLQTALTLRLVNTAFQDEAIYLYGGHRQIDHRLHGTPIYDHYANLFFGAPFLYPVLASRGSRGGYPGRTKSAWVRPRINDHVVS
jgi:hypothetical protein